MKYSILRSRKLPNSSLFKNKKFIDFSSNDYLGLSMSEKAINESHACAKKYGIGSVGSRLISGNCPLFEILEDKISKDKNTEAALVFNSGYQTNLSVINTLHTMLSETSDQTCGNASEASKNNPVILFDKLNHSSLYQGSFLSRAELVRYRHLDMNHLKDLLSKYHNRKKIIVSETVYSMDGDIAPLNDLINLSRESNSLLYLDEAHAMGILGEHGYGLSTNFNLSDIPHVIMGTFSKGIGAFGAYIACSTEIRKYLINKCTGFIYTTALPPNILGAVLSNWNEIRELKKEREQILTLSKYLRDELKKINLDTGCSETNIVPVFIKNQEDMFRIKDFLFDKKIIVSAIRPPTALTSRLRLAVNINHTKDDIDYLINVISEQF